MKIYIPDSLHCLDCNCSIPQNVYVYSCSQFHIPLCMVCQGKFKLRAEKASPEALRLYIAIRRRGIRAQLENYDGYKTVDIAVHMAKVNIEVDGGHHYYNPGQALSDLKRTFYDLKNGFLTLRVPNGLIRKNVELTANIITELLNERLTNV